MSEVYFFQVKFSWDKGEQSIALLFGESGITEFDILQFANSFLQQFWGNLFKVDLVEVYSFQGMFSWYKAD